MKCSIKRLTNGIKKLSLETGEIFDLPDDTYYQPQDKLPEWFPKDEYSGIYTNEIIMLNSTEAAVIVNDYKIRIYNCETGKVIREFEALNNEIIQIGFLIDDGNSILLVGREGGIYKISSMTGEIEAYNRISKPEDSYCDEIQCIDGCVIVVIKHNIKKYAWVFNSQDLSVQYYIEDFEFYDEENGLIYLFEPYLSRLGTVPVYSTDELIIKAEQYLSGEN